MGFLATLTGIGTNQTKTTRNNRAFKLSRYRGVQVNANSADCCEAVQGTTGKRFLSAHVPKLPLNGCDANNCRCTYELYDDRRTDIRRASDVAFDIASQLCQQDNRSSNSPDRRIDD